MKNGATPVLYFPGRSPLDVSSGGGTVYARAHAKAARALGYEPHFAYVAPEPVSGGFDIGTVHGAAHALSGRHYWMPACYRRLVELATGAAEKLARPGSPILLHSFGPWAYAAVTVRDGLRQRGIRAAVIASSYSAFMDEKWTQWIGSLSAGGAWNLARMTGVTLYSKLALEPLERRGYREADFIAVNYRTIEAALRRRFGALPPVRKITYCPELDRGDGQTAEPSPAREGVPLILCVSRHDARKGVDVLIRALAALRDEGIPFRARFLGGGHLLGAHRKLAARLGLADAIEITGFVESVSPHYREAAVFVLPSRAEQSGSLSLIEALAHGLPVVASACDGIPEDIEDGQTGLLAPPGDVAALAAQIRRLLADQPLRERLARAGGKLYRQRFTRDALAEDLGALYREAEALAAERIG